MNARGARGLALLAVAGIIGGILAVHGWSARKSGLAASAAGGLSTASSSSGPASLATPAPASPGPASPGPSASPGPARPGPSASPSRPAPASSGGAGPLLSSQPYASYAFQVWPGTPSAAARQAMTGLTISATRQGHGILVKAGANGQPGAARAYPNGTRVYVVESSLGDDSGSSDYNLGDDGVVVTDAGGRVVR